MEDFEEFQDIKKEFDAQHACWNNKSKYDKDNKENSKDELKTRVLNSKSDQQDKPILKVSDLNIENNSKRADFTAKKNASVAAENVENENPVDVQNILKPIHLAGTGMGWKCPSCPYKTKIVQNLDKHMRTHTGEKPFTCPQCDYSTAQKSNLTKHAKRVHGEN